MDLGLKGKRALVLGSSRGLGFATARTLAQEGAEVVVSGRDLGRLEAAAARIRGEGGRADTLVLDLSDGAAVSKAADALSASGAARLDILVNNSGGPPPGPISAVTAEQWSASFETMVNAIFRITASILPGMRHRGFGRIVNIVSSGVVQPIPNLGISNAMRASIIGWAKTLADEVAADGVTVNSVLPGRIQTQRIVELDAAAAQRAGKSVEDVVEASRNTIPMRRYGDPQEFANVVAFLASTQASYITGSMIRVDGGAIRSI